MWVRGHSRSLKMVPFESFSTVSYFYFFFIIIIIIIKKVKIIVTLSIKNTAGALYNAMGFA